MYKHLLRKQGIIQAYLKGRARGESRNALIAELELDIPYSSLVYIEDSALTYAGHTVWNRHSECIDGQHVGGNRYRPQDEWVITRNTHPPMITDEEAEAIAAHRSSQARKQKRFRKNDYLLSSLLRCTCGAAIDGDGGYYRCHDRCGVRSIKQETLERAVLDLLLEEMLTSDSMRQLRDEVEKEFRSRTTGLGGLVRQLNKELREVERQIGEIVSLVSQVKHQRPLLERLDALEEERIALRLKLHDAKDAEEPSFLQLTDAMLGEFVASYRSDLEVGDPEKKKAIVRSLVDNAVFDGEILTMNPSYQKIAGVNLASPRGVEPLSPP